MSVARIKKNDLVIAIAGEYAGTTGKVLRVLHDKGQAVVDGLNVARKAVRRSQANPQGGFTNREAPVDLSNLMPYDQDKKTGTRISRVREGDHFARRSKCSGRLL
jgi:large subunit ribosomal protein L24